MDPKGHLPKDWANELTYEELAAVLDGLSERDAGVLTLRHGFTHEVTGVLRQRPRPEWPG